MKNAYSHVSRDFNQKIDKGSIKKTIKSVCFLLLFLLSASLVYAQTPQYSLTTGSINNSFPFNTSSSNKVQWVYYPSDFATAPSGNITDVFFKVGSTPIGNPTFTNLTIKMGATTLTSFIAGAFTTGLTTVFTSASQTFTGVVVGGWIQITLQTPFYYNNAQNFVVEVSQTAYSGGFTIPQTPTTSNRRMYGSVTSTTASADGRLADFGFNILTGPICPVPTGVTSSNITMTSADFSWSAVTGSQGYEYAVTTTAAPPTSG
ncbi:MAG TPA: hypothetical protein VL093_10190, partial [Flavipsychrobacter sp.]|nr:hypothetical protein [Flavipsychrobacter sp.]